MTTCLLTTRLQSDDDALAQTLRSIGEKGRDAFYRGEIADKIDKFMRENGGFLRKEDFEKHSSTWVDPVSTNYRGYDVWELPPNGQGIAVLQMLNMLEPFDLKGLIAACEKDRPSVRCQVSGLRNLCTERPAE